MTLSTPRDLDGFTAALREIVGEHGEALDRPDSDWPPMFGFVGHDGLSIAVLEPLVSNDPESRDVLAVEMATLAGMNHATMCGFALSAWVLVGAAARQDLLPSQHPDRIEAVSLVVGKATGTAEAWPEIRLSYAPIRRHLDRGPTLGAWVDMPRQGQGSGRLHSAVVLGLQLAAVYDQTLALAGAADISVEESARMIRRALAVSIGLDPERLPRHAPDRKTRAGH